MSIAFPAGGEDATRRILKIAVLAVGGQGGGVLSGWITGVAQAAGWHVQSTSVAGVAQRTGATIYYIEMMPPDAGRAGVRPVFALSPAPGDVDILIAAELAEAGRAVLRGFVSPERTTLIASTHRALSVSEKIVPGDGRADASTITRDSMESARRFIAFDMETMARKAGSVISASLYGALAASGELPFGRDAFEAVIKAGGKGTEASLRAFALAYDRVGAEQTVAPVAVTPAVGDAVAGPPSLRSAWSDLQRRLSALPASVQPMAQAGLAKVVDFLDPNYGADYLASVERALRDDAGQGHAFTVETAKYLANAMVYDDIIRVADLKTRAARQARVQREVGLKADQTLRTIEYFHPRMEEVSGLLPARLGRAVVARPKLMQRLDRVVDRGRRIRTDGMLGFGSLWMIAGLRRWRRGTLRHAEETAHWQAWFDLALRERAADYELGVEILRCRRLIKGYSDTHARGLSKFDRVLSALPMLRGRADGAAWLRRLREVALADADGTGLAGALQTVASFAQDDAAARA